ncbi:beta-N-acetylhexosaminidase [Chitinophaga sp. MM2321]|uniref:beta-N-acetylhexosaminidase n=1 Tax=Chitinophaga sp. MM2321 TaxID=3137178 RepID=UPI0032D59840
MIKALYTVISGMFLFMTVAAQQIIPLPQKMTAGKGAFIINAATTIQAPQELESEAGILQQEIQMITGNQLAIEKKASGKNAIILVKTKEQAPAESYRLDISATGVTISAADHTGIFYGCMSLLQLLPAQDWKSDMAAAPVNIPSINVTDFPRFKWRGLMLDLSRTFMSPDYIKRTIRRMAFYKLNVLHLHLTDDQGWRIPINGYPLLAEKATTFDPSFHEPKEFQGYYTVADIQDLNNYAKQMHVDLVPEIESPGHSHAALFAYPDLSCSGNIAPIFPFFSGDGVTRDVFCVGNPGSAKFFRTAITETAAMFPSRYIHLGGDEVPRTEWEQCPKCQALVKSAKLDNTGALQGYFMQQLRDQAVKEGKRPVAWDEILHDNKSLTKDWVIMSWTGSKPGMEAAAKGYDVVMTPTSHMYFDYTYNSINTKKVFEFDPFSGNQDENVTRHILGIQANFWSHIDRTQARIDAQLFPRLLALAERAWSSADDKDYEKFNTRKMYHRNWLKYMDVKYYRGDFK